MLGRGTQTAGWGGEREEGGEPPLTNTQAETAALEGPEGGKSESQVLRGCRQGQSKQTSGLLPGWVSEHEKPGQNSHVTRGECALADLP